MFQILKGALSVISLPHALLIVLALCVALDSKAVGPAGFADVAKTLRVSMDGEEAGFDPQAVGESYSFTVIGAIFEPLYQYDYYGGARIVPRTAAAAPEISSDGRTWIIRLKSGIRFSDDAAFKGSKRELTADDYVYAWKRLLDPRVRSPNLSILADRLVGAHAAIDKARQTGRFDYDADFEGVRARSLHDRNQAHRPRLHVAPPAHRIGAISGRTRSCRRVW